MKQDKEIVQPIQAAQSPLWRWAFGGCMLGVVVLALVPAPPKELTTGWDKSNHLLAFAVMAWLGCKAFPNRLVYVMFGLLANGAVIEVLQSFTPTRFADWLDLLADGLGIVLGGALIAMGNRLFKPGCGRP